MDAPTFEEFLRSLAYGSVAATVAGVIISTLAEYFPKFQELAPKWKQLSFGVACFVVALGAVAVGIATNTFGVWSDIAGTWWPAIVAAFTAIGTGTMWHNIKPAALKK